MQIYHSKSAETTDVIYERNLHAPVKWKFGRSRPDVLYAFIALVVVTVVLFLISKPDAGSPFIGSLIDLLDEKSSWIIPRIQEKGWSSFALAGLFIVLLTFLLYQLLFGVLYSELEEEFIEIKPATENEKAVNEVVRFNRTFSAQWPWNYTFPRNYRNGERRQFLRFCCEIAFLLMLISNVLLFVYFYRILQGAELELTEGIFPYLYFTAIGSRLFALFISVCTLLQFANHDFGPRLKAFFSNYLGYFYPTIISVAIVAFVFSKMGQFDAFFIELVQSPGNLLLFSLFFFPVSVAIIWFGPEYSFFTDQSFTDRKDSWNLMRRTLGEGENRKSWIIPYGWLFLHSRLFDRDNEVYRPQEPPRFYLPLSSSLIPPPSEAFYRFARSLGIFYIFTLITICANIYFGNQRGWELAGILLPPAVLMVTLWYWFRGNRVFRKSERAGNLARRTVSYDKVIRFAPFQWIYDLRDRNVKPYEKAKIYYVEKRWPLWIGVTAFICALILFIITFYHSLRYSAWEMTFGWFLAFLFVSLVAFTWLMQFYEFYTKYTFDPKLKLNFAEDGTNQAWLFSPVERGQVGRWDKAMDAIGYISVQAILKLFLLVNVFFLLFFFYSLFFHGFLSSRMLQYINPLNIYLLLINGFISLLMLGNRSLKIRELSAVYNFYQNAETKEKKYYKMSARNFYGGVLVVALMLGYAYYGNSYHEVSYRSTSDQANKQSLLEYTERFVNRSEKGDTLKPVIFIAADGGGLKACYWTMLQLHRLDSLGLFDDQVFMLSGASGGNMGLAMYTYLKAQPNLNLVQIRSIIQEIGETNFLSGDFTGLVTRFPINFLPELPGWKASTFDDRSEAMANAYFNIVGRHTPNYDYQSIRQRPYSWIWEQTDYQLPLFVSNTTRAEDGAMGYAHPFSDERIVPGMIDLSVRGKEEISFPDAAFLANRFPIMSPAGRIEGRGHFVDAGNSDNSGISTIMHFLEYMSARLATAQAPEEKEIWQRFFNHDIILLSVRNDKKRFIRDEFYELKEQLNRNFYRSELSANTNAALNSGLVGVANYWDDYLRSAVRKDLGLISSYYYLDLPFYLTEEDVHYGLDGQLVYDRLEYAVSEINASIDTTLQCNRVNGGCFAVAPPLGRLMAKPSLDYMAKLVDYPHNALVYRKLSEFSEKTVPLIDVPKAWEVERQIYPTVPKDTLKEQDPRQ